MSRSGREGVHLVTQARTPKSQDIGYRERRYLIMMGIRLACFVLAIVTFANGGGWLTLFPAVGAVVIPYFAVVFANGGREPNDTRGFQEYQPNLPEPHPSPVPRGQVHLSGLTVRAARQAGDTAPGRGGSGTGAAAAPGSSVHSGHPGHSEPIEPARPADPYIQQAWTGDGSSDASRVPAAGAGRQARSGASQSGPEKQDGNG